MEFSYHETVQRSEKVLFGVRHGCSLHLANIEASMVELDSRTRDPTRKLSEDASRPYRRLVVSKSE